MDNPMRKQIDIAPERFHPNVRRPGDEEIMAVVFRITHAPRPALHARSGLAAPMIIVDEMPPTRHMADGGYYTSKRKFRTVTRAHGCVEVGNDPAMLRRPQKPKPDRTAIRAAIARAFSRAGIGG